MEEQILGHVVLALGCKVERRTGVMSLERTTSQYSISTHKTTKNLHDCIQSCLAVFQFTQQHWNVANVENETKAKFGRLKLGQSFVTCGIRMSQFKFYVYHTVCHIPRPDSHAPRVR